MLPMPVHSRGVQFLTGCWQGLESGEPSPWDRQSDLVSHFDIRTDQEGVCLIGDYSEQREGQVVYQAHAVVGWDEEQGCPYLFWFDARTARTCPVAARGRWEDHQLIFEGGGICLSYNLDGPDGFTFRRECGSPQTRVTEARFVRMREQAQPAVPGESCPFRPLCPAARVMQRSPQC